MTEVKQINKNIKNQFDENIFSYMNSLSDMLEYDVLRYDRILNAEVEVDEY